ncbi:hypothetical protein DFH06DRAFT_1234904 [Mycena polygramma]|nr:hypothetical protein DFH06DRAFT_1234904 [Mycena polygramma]
MFVQGHGYPLARPLSTTFPVAYLRRGISIGDDGMFDFLFNIYLPADHPINDGDRNNFPAALSFRSTSMFGAICGLPCGSKVKRLTDLDKLRQYAMSCAANWPCPCQRFSISRHWHRKSDSWGIACIRQLYQGGSCMHLMHGQIHDQNSPCYWLHSGSHTGEFTNQPNDFDVHEWTRVMGRYRPVLIHHDPRTSWIARLFSWIPSWLVSALWHWPSWFAKAYFAPFHHQFFHPSMILTEYLLGRVPDASSVVNEPEPPDAAELLRRAQKVFKITREKDGAYLTRRKTR